jgi:hypothetical protein
LEKIKKKTPSFQQVEGSRNPHTSLIGMVIGTVFLKSDLEVFRDCMCALQYGRLFPENMPGKFSHMHVRHP